MYGLMLNDRSSTLSLLETRRSGKARDMTGPGPTPEEMKQILTIAARTPDHGKLTPWRFITVEGDQRDAFAVLLRQALAEEDPCAPPAKHDKADQFARQGEALVVLVSAPIHDHKIPVWEQQLSAGAAVMNLLLAAHALGFVGNWLTGWAAYSERVQAAFCGPGEKIAGFIFIGRPRADLEERPRPVLDDIARAWIPPALDT